MDTKLEGAVYYTEMHINITPPFETEHDAKLVIMNESEEYSWYIELDGTQITESCDQLPSFASAVLDAMQVLVCYMINQVSGKD